MRKSCSAISPFWLCQVWGSLQCAFCTAFSLPFHTACPPGSVLFSSVAIFQQRGRLHQNRGLWCTCTEVWAPGRGGRTLSSFSFSFSEWWLSHCSCTYSRNFLPLTRNSWLCSCSQLSIWAFRTFSSWNQQEWAHWAWSNKLNTDCCIKMIKCFSALWQICKPKSKLRTWKLQKFGTLIFNISIFIKTIEADQAYLKNSSNYTSVIATGNTAM